MPWMRRAGHQRHVLTVRATLLLAMRYALLGLPKALLRSMLAEPQMWDAPSSEAMGCPGGADSGAAAGNSAFGHLAWDVGLATLL